MSRLIIWPSMMLLGRAETKLRTLKYGSKPIQTSLILRQRPPKPYKLLQFFMISVRLFKMGKHSDFHLSFFQIVGAWRDFTVVTKLIKNFKGLYGFGGRCLNIRDVCVGFEPYLKVHNLVSVHPKNIILGQMINLNMIFHVVVSVYRLVKIWNSPQFPVEFRNGLLQSVVCLLGVYLCSFSNNKNCLEAKGNELIQEKNTKPCFKWILD